MSPTLKDVGPIEATEPKSTEVPAALSPTLKDVGPIEAEPLKEWQADELDVSDVERRRPH